MLIPASHTGYKRARALLALLLAGYLLGPVIHRVHHGDSTLDSSPVDGRDHATAASDPHEHTITGDHDCLLCARLVFYSEAEEPVCSFLPGNEAYPACRVAPSASLDPCLHAIRGPPPVA